jgi:hypothetical protein
MAVGGVALSHISHGRLMEADATFRLSESLLPGMPVKFSKKQLFQLLLSRANIMPVSAVTI